MCTIGVHHTGVAVQLWHLSLPTGITVDSLISIFCFVREVLFSPISAENAQ